MFTSFARARFARGFFVFFLAFAFAQSAFAQSEKEQWVSNIPSSQWNKDPEPVCRAIEQALLPGVVGYKGSIYDDNYETSQWNRQCIDQTGQTAPITYKCVRRSETGEVLGTSLGPCPQRVQLCSTSDGAQSAPTTFGNPCDVRTGVKSETHIDWRAPKEPRFAISRYYRSDGRNLGSALDTQSQQLHPGSWRSPFNDAFRRLPDATWEYRGASANNIVFEGEGRYANEYPVNPGSDAYVRMTSPGSLSERTWLYDGSPRSMRFSWGTWDRVVDTIRWDDGYQITVSRNNRAYYQNGIVTVVQDNRGHRAQFTWSNSVVSNSGVEAVSRVEIDTDYDGTTFAPDVAIDYVYADNIRLPGTPLLAQVQRTDLALQTTETIFEYNYLSETGPGASGPVYPLLLTALRDGRLDDQGHAFDYATFTYAAGENPVTETYGVLADGRELTTYRPMLTSSHANGADAYARAEGGIITNPLGQVETRSFAIVDNRVLTTSVVDEATANTVATTTSYDFTPNAGAPEGFVYSRTEKNGAVTTFERDALGRILTQTEDSNGLAPRVTTYTWHDDQRLPETRTTGKMSEAFVYDANDLLISYSQTDVDPVSPTNGQVRTWTYSYTTLASGLRVVETVDGPGLAADGINDVTTYTYNADGTLASTTDPNGLVTTVDAYSALGQPTQITQPDGIVWSFTYDIVGRMLSSTRDPNGASATTTYTYDVAGQLTSMTDMVGQTWTYTYDGARRLTDVVSPGGEKTTYTHDAMGNVTRMAHSQGTGAAQFWEDSSYDALGRLAGRLGANAQTTSFTHDVQDNLDGITDPIGKTIDNSFDALNRVVQVIDKANFTTFMDHDVNDSQTGYTDPRGLTTSFAYNGFGEVIQETSPDRGTMTYAYNSRGLVTSMTDARGVAATYEYDDGGRLTAKRFPSSPSEDQVFTWDMQLAGGPTGRGKPVVTSDESGSTSLNYEAGTGFPLDRTTQLDGVDYVLTFAHDAEGRLTELTYPSGRTVTVTRDQVGRVSGVTTDASGGGGGTSLATVGESGAVTVNQSNSNQWHSVTFATPISDPVVVLGPVSYAGSHPTTTRVRNLTSTGFEFQMDEWDYLDGGHTTETIGWFAISAGEHTLENGLTLVAGRAEVGTGASTLNYGITLNAPVVFTEVLTVNEASALATRIENVTPTSFRVRIQEEEAGGAHVPETVGWIAVESGTSSAFDARVTPSRIDEVTVTTAFTTSFSAAPVLIADMQTRDGGDTAVLRRKVLSTSAMSLFVEEEKSKDNELGHIFETVGYLAIASGAVLAEVTVSGPQQVVSNAQYMPNGPLTSMDYGDGATFAATYDTSYRLTGLRDTIGGSDLRNLSHGYTLRDNLASITDVLDPTRDESFTYSSREFLATADGPYSPIGYTYDPVGNRLTKTVGGTTDTYSYGTNDNRLMSIAGGTTRSLTYDATGNVTYDNRAGQGYGYSYNAAGRMESFSIDGVVQAEYVYNAQGQQAIRRLTQTGEVIHNIFDLDGNRIAEYLYDAGLGTSTLIREYIWMDGRAVGVIEGGQLFYIRTDHIGRPAFATNDLGVKVWDTEYLPFGGVFTSTGGIDLRFPGQWFQLESGLHQNWMRDYDPTTGRYIQADPLGLVDGASVYGYALQNPGRYVDPRGLMVGPQSLPGTRSQNESMLWCASDDDDLCRKWFERIMDEYWELLDSGSSLNVRMLYNLLADEYNRQCAYEGSGRPEAPLLPVIPPKSEREMLPVPPLLGPFAPGNRRPDGGGGFGGKPTILNPKPFSVSY